MGTSKKFEMRMFEHDRTHLSTKIELPSKFETRVFEHGRTHLLSFKMQLPSNLEKRTFGHGRTHLRSKNVKMQLPSKFLATMAFLAVSLTLCFAEAKDSSRTEEMILRNLIRRRRLALAANASQAQSKDPTLSMSMDASSVGVPE